MNLWCDYFRFPISSKVKSQVSNPKVNIALSLMLGPHYLMLLRPQQFSGFASIRGNQDLPGFLQAILLTHVVELWLLNPVGDISPTHSLFTFLILISQPDGAAPMGTWEDRSLFPSGEADSQPEACFY